MKKIAFTLIVVLSLAALTACSTKADTSAQTRTDLTADHIQGLYQDMDQKAVQDLLGTHDSALSGKETTHLYSLADGSTAVLRYVDDKLKGAYIRTKDNVEDTIFNGFHPDDGNDGDYNTNDGKVVD